MTAYKIGQLIYVVLRGQNTVYPMMITEVISKQTMEGDSITYMVAGGSGTGAQVLPIDKVDGEIFTSAAEVKRMLLERATNGINQLVNNAVTKAKEWYPTATEATTEGWKSNTEPPHKSIHAPGPQIKARGAKSTKAREEVPPVTEELPVDGDGVTVQMPDGTVARVKLPASM